ncbi:3'-5' ssDNA/RNA exonuclease TatD-like [Haliotis rubra]|uniref:3'-5' ssDNA/RNA exonuclease TatD-like n=1 Tax=Haliotis rubra TaxID=36100 RepID=UPI001EE54D7C|nr:3'-5' ssDNA/RNA exonuclease TatD-like [Haliotis rubra]
MCLDPSIQVYIHVDKHGKSKECAEVVVPKTLTKEVLQMDGMLLKGKELSVKKPENMQKRVTSKWRKNEEGTVFCLSECVESVVSMSKERTELMYHMIDAGAYLVDPGFTAKKDVNEVIKRAFLSGVEKVVVKTLTVRQAMKAKALADSFPGIIYFTAGIHPTQESSWKGETTVQQLRDLLSHPQCVALGEIGLERNYTDSRREMFRAQVKLACDMDIPLVLCDTSKLETTQRILSEFKDKLPPVCISGDRQTTTDLKAFCDMGFYISLTGNAWKLPYTECPRDWLSSVSHDIETTRLLLASEAPGKFPDFISNYPGSSISYRRAMFKVDCSNLLEDNSKLTMKYCCKRNEPFSVHTILELASGRVQRTPQQLADMVRQNAYTFYRFSEKSDGKMVESSEGTCSEVQEVTSEVVDLQPDKRKKYVFPGLTFILGILMVTILLTFQYVWKLDSVIE